MNYYNLGFRSNPYSFRPCAVLRLLVLEKCKLASGKLESKMITRT